MNASMGEDVLSLSISERIQLVEDIWDSIAEAPESFDLPDSQKAELERRLEAYRGNPSGGSVWNVVLERITAAK